MSQTRKEKPLKESNQEESDQLVKLIQRKVEVPPVEEALAAAKHALKQAQLQARSEKQVRTHRCRVCYEHDCLHFEREYDDNKEHVDMKRDPETGQMYIDKDGD